MEATCFKELESCPTNLSGTDLGIDEGDGAIAPRHRTCRVRG